jgi:hypothetical protein
MIYFMIDSIKIKIDVFHNKAQKIYDTEPLSTMISSCQAMDLLIDFHHSPATDPIIVRTRR